MTIENINKKFIEEIKLKNKTSNKTIIYEKMIDILLLEVENNKQTIEKSDYLKKQLKDLIENH